MDIRISVDRLGPIEGCIETEADGPRPFSGWLELLRTLAELTATRAAALGAPAGRFYAREDGDDGEAGEPADHPRTRG